MIIKVAVYVAHQHRYKNINSSLYNNNNNNNRASYHINRPRKTKIMSYIYIYDLKQTIGL